MEIPERKKLEDLPKFVVNAIRRGPVSSDGYQEFEIEGSFDPRLEGTFEEIIEGNGPQWFWLLFGERGYLSPTLKSFDKQARTAVLISHEKEEPKVLGLTLSYLSSYWQASDVWMVLDLNWGWERRQFEGADAVAEDYEAEDVSIVDGREVKVWTKLEPAGVSRGQSRHYPAADQNLPVRPGTRLVPAAWDHEHCQLCHEHIDGGMFGYCDPENRWMCESCYERYVAPHDLSFIDEL